jgi:hypothetical protein
LGEAHEEDIEPHVKEWIDKENETKIRGKKLYKKNIIPIIINKSLLYKERFGINIDGEWCTVCIKKLERTVDGLDEKSKLSCSGYLEDKEESSVVFTSRGDIVSGRIRTPDESYTITPGPENKSGQRDAFRIHIVGKIDQGAFAGADH